MSWLTLIVLVRVGLSVSANAVQKQLLLARAPVGLIWLITYALLIPPSLALAAIHPSWPSTLFWRDILLGGLLDAFGNLAMVAALRSTDVSVFGPLNAFRPLLALGFGWFFLGETPTWMGGLGVGITVAGAAFLLGRDDRETTAGDRGPVARVLLWRVVGLSLSSLGAVFLKRAAVTGSVELTLAGWVVSGAVVLFLVSVWRGQLVPAELAGGFRLHRRWLLWHGAMFFALQWLTILIFQRTLLAYSFVFFQLAMFFQVIVGRFVFQEPAFRRRMAACAVMAAGGALILWKG
jgi:drug/metabolite transporter (DMT)-like permease